LQGGSSGGTDGNVLIADRGLVGIGTDAPTVKLDVNGQIRIRGGSTPAVGDVLTATSTDGTADWQTPAGSDDGDWELDVDGYVLYSGGDWGLSRYGNSLLTSGTTSPDAINTHVNWGVNSTTGISTGFDVYYATVGGGGDNNAYGYGSTISGGRNNEAGTYSVVGGGSNNNAGNWLGFVGGGEDNSSTGQYAVVPGGYGNTAQSYGEVVCGLFATVGSGSWNSWIGTDRLFVVGNGTGTSSRSDAMTILKNGNVGIGTSSPAAKLEVANGDALIYGITVGRGGGANSTNTVVGRDALSSNTTGSLNTAIGYRSQQLNLSTQDNTSLGGHALMNNRANFNTAVGAYSLSANTSGTRNSALGHSALTSNETANDNTAVGYFALANNFVGIDNTAVGSKSLESNINNRNTAVGSNTLNQNTVGSDNTAVGYYTLAQNQVGVMNSAFGSQALENLNPPSAAPQGFYNSAVGHKALQSLSTGYGNTAMGYFAGQAGTALTTGYYNTGIGYQASFDANNRINTIVLAGNGNLSLGGNNRVRIGNSSMTSIGGQVLWTALSDERIKTDVEEDVPGLAFITKLRPVTYSFDIDKQDELMWGAKNESDWEGKYDIESIRFSGFIAQEVEKAAKSINYSFSGIDKPDGDGLYGIRYAEFVVPLVKAVQELTAENAELRSEIERLKALEARIEALENK
ncbi:MAG: tail fiber domain-containing protein, partial [bacterium]